MSHMNHCFFRTHLSLLLLAGLILMPVVAHANPERVFDRVSPSVVSVATDEAVASGFVIKPEGVIMTRLSLIDSPTPIRVTAEVSDRGKRETRTFKKIEILKVHPDYDVAMIRVLDAGTARFKPVSRSTRKLVEDDDIFIVGIAPLSDPEKLDRSIEDGQVNELDQKIDQNSYVQVSAAVTPWSLGSAMCDSSGRVVGLIVGGINLAVDNQRTPDLKQVDIGFAAPISTLTDRQLVPLDKRPKNEHLSKVYQSRGTAWYQLAGRLGSDDRPIALQFALASLRYARSLNPDNMDVLREIGKVWIELEKPELAVAYLQPVAEKKPLDSNNWLSLGRAQLASEDKEVRAAAADSLRRGADLPNSSKHHTDQRAPYRCKIAFAELMLEREQWALAAYYATWSGEMKFPGTNATDKWASARADISDAQFELLSKADKKFSRDDADSFLELNEEATTLLTREQRDKLLDERGELWQQVDRRVQPLAKMVSTALPERPCKVVWSEHATMLALHFKESQLVGLFDPVTARIKRYLPLPSTNCVIAGGGRRLIAFNNDNQTCLIWNLADETGKPKSIKIELGGLRVLYLAMGHHAPHAAAAAVIDDSEKSKPITFATINLDKAQVYHIRAGESITGQYGPNQLALTVSPWFDALRCNRGSGKQFALIDGRKMQYVAMYQSEKFKHLTDPETITFLRHVAPGIDPRDESRYKDRGLMPIVGSSQWIKRLPYAKPYESSGLGLVDDEFKVIGTYPFSHRLNADFFEDDVHAPIYAHAALQRAVIIPDENRAYVIPFTLPSKEAP